MTDETRTTETERYETIERPWMNSHGIDALAVIVEEPGQLRSHYIRRLYDSTYSAPNRTAHLRINDLIEDGLVRVVSVEGRYNTMLLYPTEAGAKVLELCRQIGAICKGVKE